MWRFTFKVERIQGPSKTQRDHKHSGLSLHFSPRNIVSSEQNIPCVTLSSQIGLDATTQEIGRGKEVLQLEQANTARFESHKNPGHSEISFPQEPVCTVVQENSPSAESHQLCLMVCCYLTDLRPTYSTTPSEEAERDHSFLGCCQTLPLLHLICKRAPVLLHWLQIPESNGNTILPTVEEKHLFCLVESNFKSPVNVTGISDDGVKKHLQTVSTH